MSIFRGAIKQVESPLEAPADAQTQSEKIRVSVIDYDENVFEEGELKAVEECSAYRGKPTITWVNVDGLHEIEVIEKVARCFHLHPLVIEDIVDTNQRPKAEDLDDQLFVVFKMLEYDDERDDIVVEQVSLLFGENSVLSFEERRKEGDAFDSVRQMLRNAKGKIRKEGTDHLAYLLLDAVVDGYFVVLEKLGDKIEVLEEDLVANATSDTLQRLHRLKRHLIALRKSIWPMREAVSYLERSESPLLRETTRIYLRDLYDHAIQVMEAIETYREMIAGMLDIYLSSVSNRMNEIMKVLTIIATIFIPLTWLVGVYGMNFDYIPELRWRWGYFITMGVMVITALVMVIYFRCKRWF